MRLGRLGLGRSSEGQMASEAQPQGPSDNPIDWQRDRKQITRAAGMITAAIIVGALYVASEVLIPITLAALLTFILAPLANWLPRSQVPAAPLRRAPCARDHRRAWNRYRHAGR